MTALQDKDADTKKRLEFIEKIVIIGNGDPPLRETARANSNWINANLELPKTVEKHSGWILTFDRVAWIVVTVLIGIFLEFGCAASIGVVLLLNSAGLLKVP